MKKNLSMYLVVILFLASSHFGCAPKTIVTTSVTGAIDSENRLLIATQDSEFKNAVVSNILDDLGKKNVSIEIVDLVNLSGKPVENYDAIVILNDYKFLRLDEDVIDFLEKMDKDTKQKTILLTTAGSPGLVGKIPEIDAVTSASKTAKVEVMSDMVLQKINYLLFE